LHTGCRSVVRRLQIGCTPQTSHGVQFSLWFVYWQLLLKWLSLTLSYSCSHSFSRLFTLTYFHLLIEPVAQSHSLSVNNSVSLWWSQSDEKSSLCVSLCVCPYTCDSVCVQKSCPWNFRPLRQLRPTDILCEWCVVYLCCFALNASSCRLAVKC